MLPASLRSVSLSGKFCQALSPRPSMNRMANFTVSTGNSITTNVTMTSRTSGSVAIHNLSTGQSIVGTVSGGTALTGKSAEWILEDVSSGGGEVPFAAFPRTTFTGNDALLTTGAGVTADGATLIDLVQSSTLCTASESGNVITFTDS